MVKYIKIKLAVNKKIMKIGDFCSMCADEIEEGEEYFELLRPAYIDEEDLEILCKGCAQ